MRFLIAFTLGLALVTRTAYAADGGVLVLGGTGQLGSEVVKALVSAGEDVSVLIRPTSDRTRIQGLNVTFVTGDMLSEDDMERVFTGTTYRAVIDASSAAFTGAQDFYEKSQRIVAKWAAATGVGQLILHGAIGAGDSASLIYVENASNVQQQAIASKTVAEKILIDSGVPYTIIRHLTLLPMETRESGNARLTTDRTAVGAVTRDGLARLTRECLDNAECLNAVFHAVDDDAAVPERLLAGWRRIVKPDYLPAYATGP